MAIDPNILLQYRGPDIGNAVVRGIQGAAGLQSMQQAAQEAPLRQQLLQSQVQAAPAIIEDQQTKNAIAKQNLEIEGRAIVAQRAIPYLQNGDMAGLKNFLSGTNLLDDNDKAELIGQIDNKDLQGLLGNVTGAINLAQQKGFFEMPSAASDTRTAIQKNLEAAGFMPGSPEYQQAMMQQLTKPSGTQISVQMPGQKFLTAEAEALGKSYVKKYETVQSDSIAASQQRDTLRQLKALNINTGLTTDVRASVANVFNNLGLNGNELLNIDVGNVQAFNKLSGRLVQEGMMAQKGVATDNDAKLYAQTVPKITDDKKATNFIIESMNAQNERKIEKEQFYTDWLEVNEGSLKGADKAWNQYISSTPLYIEGYNNRIGLPYTFYEFSNEIKTLNPGLSESEIIKLWQNKAKGI